MSKVQFPKVSYRNNPNYCLICDNRITPKISKRRFCLECGMLFYDQIKALENLKLNFLFVFNVLSI